jgi:hypothetical protein
MCRNEHPPIVGCPVGRVADVQTFRHRALSERDDLIFIRLRVESERLDQLVHAGEFRCRVHGLREGDGMNKADWAASTKRRARSASSRSRERRSPSSPASEIRLNAFGAKPNSCCGIGKRRLFRFIGWCSFRVSRRNGCRISCAGRRPRVYRELFRTGAARSVFRCSNEILTRPKHW